MVKLLIVALFGLAIPTASYASIDVNLVYGTHGEQVVELQEFLIDHGFLFGQATGNFYSLTKKAVQKYQNSVGLPTTGFVGILTRGKINEILNNNSTEETNINIPIATTSIQMHQQTPNLSSPPIFENEPPSMVLSPSLGSSMPSIQPHIPECTLTATSTVNSADIPITKISWTSSNVETGVIYVGTGNFVGGIPQYFPNSFSLKTVAEGEMSDFPSNRVFKAEFTGAYGNATCVTN